MNRRPFLEDGLELRRKHVADLERRADAAAGDAQLGQPRLERARRAPPRSARGRAARQAARSSVAIRTSARSARESGATVGMSSARKPNSTRMPPAPKPTPTPRSQPRSGASARGRADPAAASSPARRRRRRTRSRRRAIATGPRQIDAVLGVQQRHAGADRLLEAVAVHRADAAERRTAARSAACRWRTRTARGARACVCEPIGM